MGDTIFVWSGRSVEHIGKHDVSPGEAEEVVARATSPYPQRVGREKFAVWGKTRRERLLQVIFVYASLEDLTVEEYESLDLHERLALEHGEVAVRAIHARDLSESEKRRLRRLRKR